MGSRWGNGDAGLRSSNRETARPIGPPRLLRNAQPGGSGTPMNGPGQSPARLTRGSGLHPSRERVSDWPQTGRSRANASDGEGSALPGGSKKAMPCAWPTMGPPPKEPGTIRVPLRDAAPAREPSGRTPSKPTEDPWSCPCCGAPMRLRAKIPALKTIHELAVAPTRSPRERPVLCGFCARRFVPASPVASPHGTAKAYSPPPRTILHDLRCPLQPPNHLRHRSGGLRLP